MEELASRDKIEPDALIHYVIDGIQDDTNINKMVLYRARKLDERLKAYEAIQKKKNQKKEKASAKRVVLQTGENQQRKRCRHHRRKKCE